MRPDRSLTANQSIRLGAFNVYANSLQVPALVNGRNQNSLDDFLRKPRIYVKASSGKECKFMVRSHRARGRARVLFNERVENAFRIHVTHLQANASDVPPCDMGLYVAHAFEVGVET